MLKVKILSISVIKIVPEQRRSFWHANGHWKRDKHPKIDFQLLGFAGNKVELNLNFGFLTPMLKVKILLIPAIKIALEQRENFWHANGHLKREKYAKIDLRLAGYVYNWCETLNHNPVCQKNHCFFDSMRK